MGRLLGFKYENNGQPTWHPYPDFGDSTKYKDKSVNAIIKEALPVSAVLGLMAYVLALVAGLGIGIFAAYKQNTWFDHVGERHRHAGSGGTEFYSGPGAGAAFQPDALLAAARTAGMGVRMGLPQDPDAADGAAARGHTLGPVHRLYRAAHAFGPGRDAPAGLHTHGAREGTFGMAIVTVHALRGAILPVVSFSGPALAFLITGTVVVERMFAIPGLGAYFIDAANNRDHFLILGLTAFGAIALMFANLAVDVAYAYIDPRIRYE